MSNNEGLTTKQQYDRTRYQRLKAERKAAADPDPIVLLSDPTVAYLAGLTDADGSIYVTHANKLKTYPVICWAMTHRPTIEWLADALGGTALQLHNHTTLRRGTTTWGSSKFRPQYRTSVTGSRARLLCQRMLPYMHTKAEQATLVSTFPVDARSAPGVTLPESVRLERIALGKELSMLNHR